MRTERARTEASAAGHVLLHLPRAHQLIEALAPVSFLDTRVRQLLEAIRAHVQELGQLEQADGTLMDLAQRARFPMPAAFMADCMDLAAPELPLEALLREPVEPEAPPVFRCAAFADTEPLDLPAELIPGLPRSAVSLLHGAEGIGKTALALQLGIAQAAGGDWLGHAITPPGPVLFLAQETGSAELQARVHAVAREQGHELRDLQDRLGVVTEAELAGRYLQGTRDLELLERTALALGAVLVIIDHLSALSPDERDLGQHRIIEHLRQLAHRTGAAVLVLDHDNKAGFSERGAHAGRALKRRTAASTFWMGEERGAPFLEVGKARYLAADERGRVWLTWRSLPDPWDRMSAGRPVTWGYLERSAAAPTTTRRAENQDRLTELLPLVPEVWVSTQQILERLPGLGGYAELDAESLARTLRRDLSRLSLQGQVEKRTSRGRVPSAWRRAGSSPNGNGGGV